MLASSLDVGHDVRGSDYRAIAFGRQNHDESYVGDAAHC